MSLAPRLDLRQSQSLVMTPQLQQAIKLLTLSNLEVEAFIAEEVEKNPLLVSGAEEGAAPERPETREAAGADELVKTGSAQDVPLDPGYSSETGDWDRGGAGSAVSDEGIDFDSFACPEGSLCDHLLSQAGQVLSGTDLLVAQAIIDALDDAGYLTERVPDLALRLGVARAQVERVLAAVQRLDPVGVGARSLAECLALQAQEADRYDPCMAALIDNLDLLATGRIAQLQRICRVDDEDMADMIRELRSYDPKPGLRFGGGRVEAIVPDILVHEAKSGWRIEINPATLPRVLLDRRYQAELRRGAGDKASRAWLAECSASANWLLKALDQRQQTIIKVSTAIVKAQDGFFRQGVSALRPLTLRQVADEVGLHESTISRVTSNKYLWCARGTFELKYFFGSGVATDDGEAASALAVKAAIRTLIAAEPPHAILSDDALVELLRAQGFELARRTVAKYREAIGIGSSVQRRRAAAINSKAA